MSRGGPWTTTDELIFIDGMCTWRDDGLPATRHERRKALLQYRDSLRLRKDWGRIDKAKVLERIRSEIGP